MNQNTIQAKPELALAFGKKGKNGPVWNKRVLRIDSLSQAASTWEAFRDENDLCASESPYVGVIDVATGQQIATVSYNARLWDMSGAELKA